MMTTEIVKNENSDMPALMEQAKILIESGFLPTTIKQPAQAVAIMLTGRELNIPTMQALRQINVIQGKPTMSAELMLSLAYQRIPNFKCIPITSTNEIAEFEFRRPNQPVYRHKFTIADAKSLGLCEKDNWKKQPAVMLRWRCISAGLRLIAPDAIAGVYTPEEIDTSVEVDAQTGELSPVQKEIRPVIAAPVEVTPTQGEEKLISKQQRDRLFAINRASGKTEDGLRQYLRDEYGIESTKDIAKEIYEDICKWAEAK